VWVELESLNHTHAVDGRASKKRDLQQVGLMYVLEMEKNTKKELKKWHSKLSTEKEFKPMDEAFFSKLKEDCESGLFGEESRICWEKRKAIEEKEKWEKEEHARLKKEKWARLEKQVQENKERHQQLRQKLLKEHAQKEEAKIARLEKEWKEKGLPLKEMPDWDEWNLDSSSDDDKEGGVNVLEVERVYGVKYDPEWDLDTPSDDEL